MRGGIEQAAAYCKKDFHAHKEGCELFESGTMVKSGGSGEVKQALETHDTLDDLIDQNPELYCRFRNGLIDIYARRQVEVNKPVPVVRWYYGATGTGKSREAFSLGQQSPDGFWVAPLSLDWFDGYTGQGVVLFDDFRSKYINAKYGFSGFLRLLDRYPVSVNIRGQKPVPWVPREILITSNVHPQHCFDWKNASGEVQERDVEDVQQLLRRITEIRHFGRTVDYE